MSRKAEPTAAAPAPPAPPAPLKIFFKTKLCKFNLVGKCKRGRDCKYAHDKQEMQALPDFSCTSFCPALRDTGFCSGGSKCKFAHSKEELQPRIGNKASNASKAEAKSAKAPAPPLVMQAVPESDCSKKILDEDLDEDLDLPNSWSRQSTEEPTMELDFDSDEEWEEASEAVRHDPAHVEVEVKRRASWADIEDDETPSAVEAGEPCLEGGNAALDGERSPLELIASTFGITYALKNSFLAFGDVGEEPVTVIRRVQSTGALNAVGC